MKVYIVGAGPGDEKYLTAEAHRVLASSELVVTTPRLYERLSHLNTNMVCKNIAEFSTTVMAAQNSCATVTVLVSGDSGFFSASKKLVSSLHGLEVECLCGISSLQYLCAKLNMTYDSIKILSVHGRSGNVIPAVCYNPVVFALTGGEEKAHTVIGRLLEAGLGDVEVAVGENLSAPNEKILSGTARSLAQERFADLASIIIRNDAYVAPHNQIPDHAFIRGKVPMTKQAVRTLAIAALNIQPDDIVLDIGAGSGSVTVEMARKAHEGIVYAVEKEPDALELIRQNRAHFRAFNITLIPAAAPDRLDELPSPDKVFIGGSGGRLPEIIALLASKNPYAGIVVTAITLETLHEAMNTLAAHGYAPEITCINAATAHKAGKYHMMKAENPVYIISGKRNAE